VYDWLNRAAQPPGVPFRLSAYREWNEAQQKVVQSFQQSTAHVDEKWLYLILGVPALLLVIILLSKFLGKRG